MSTYTPIASVTLDSAQSSVTFSGIPQTYTDLVLVAAVTGVSVATDPWIRINSDTGTNYSWTWLSGNGSAASSERGTNNSKLYYSAISTIQNNVQLIQFNFMNYSNTTTYKTVLWRESDAGTETGATVGLWRSTSAINTLEISLDASRTYSAGTTFNLYGVANASITNVAKATGGDSVYTDGTYWYHIFRSSGTFTPTQALTADYLVVAGGAGGGWNYGGGGGAGGMRCTVTATGGGGSLESALSLTAQAYTVTVGAGGASTTNGSNSVFSSITSTGGGAGKGNSVSPETGATGGSGGGGGASGTKGSGTANQGYAGGDGYTDGATYGVGGGGGGAGAAATNGSSSGGGNGGNGVATSISGSSVTYAGGGAGGGDSRQSKPAGTAGTGGGGAGTQSGNASAGTANTGGGGGGSGHSATAGGAGGSGIVIVRYGV